MSAIFVYEHLCALEAGSGGRPAIAQSLLNEGRAMFDAVSMDFRDAGFAVLTVADERKDSFLTLVAQADYCLIIAPEFDGILESRCRWVEEAGGKLLGPSSKAVRLTADKLELFHHFQRVGIASPPTWRFEQAPHDLYPRVCKPRFGAGSQDTFCITEASIGAATGVEMKTAAKVREMIVQEYVPGLPASVSFLIGPRQCMVLQPGKQRLSRDGRLRYLGGEIPLTPELAARAVAISGRSVDSVRGLLGYVGVDVVLGSDPDRDRVIEINPRLTTSYIGLRNLANFNIAETMVRIFDDKPVTQLDWKQGLVEFTVE